MCVRDNVCLRKLFYKIIPVGRSRTTVLRISETFLPQPPLQSSALPTELPRVIVYHLLLRRMPLDPECDPAPSLFCCFLERRNTRHLIWELTHQSFRPADCHFSKKSDCCFPHKCLHTQRSVMSDNTGDKIVGLF